MAIVYTQRGACRKPTENISIHMDECYIIFRISYGNKLPEIVIIFNYSSRILFGYVKQINTIIIVLQLIKKLCIHIVPKFVYISCHLVMLAYNS